MSRELLRRLRDATPNEPQTMDMYNLLLEVDRELAKPEPQPVALIRTWHKSGDQHADLHDWLEGFDRLPDGEHKLYTRDAV